MLITVIPINVYVPFQELHETSSVFKAMSNAALCPATEKAAVALVLGKLEAFATGFSTSLEEDEAALASASAESAELILSFRVAKKRTLAKVKGLMESIAERQNKAPKKSALVLAKEHHGAAWAGMDNEAKRAAMAEALLLAQAGQLQPGGP